jgi:hypothetical protein
VIGHSAWGKHWELSLRAADHSSLVVHVDNFTQAADALLHWLRDIDSAQLLEDLKGHLFATTDCPSGFVLHEPEQVGERKPA